MEAKNHTAYHARASSPYASLLRPAVQTKSPTGTSAAIERSVHLDVCPRHIRLPLHRYVPGRRNFHSQRSIGVSTPGQ